MSQLREEIHYFEEASRFYQAGQLDQAALYYQLAIELLPAFSEARYQLACVYFEQSQPELAVVQLKLLLDDNPVFAPAFFQLGRVYQVYFGAFEEALGYYQQAIELNDQYFEAHVQMGWIYRSLEKPAAALRAWLRAIYLKPDSPDILVLIADVMLALGDTRQACQYYLRVLDYQPDNTYALEAWFKLTVGQGEQGMMQTLIQLALTYPHLRAQLACQAALLLEGIDHLQEARQCYQMALALPELTEREAWQLKAELLVPILFERVQEPALVLNHLEQALMTVTGFADVVGIEPSLTNYESYFLNIRALNRLAYLDYNPRTLRHQLCTWLKRCLPALPFYGAHSGSPGKRRIAFLLAYSERISRALMGMLQRLSPEIGDILILTTHPYEADDMRRKLPQSHLQHVLLPEQPEQALAELRALKLDILYFAEQNSPRLLHSLLASYRSASVQCTSWLSSGTTGQPEMDYFLSSVLLETTENAQSWYTEKLVLNQTLPVFVSRPQAVPHWPRRDYGLPESGCFYVCPYELYALQPLFDQILQGILERDSQGFIALMLRPDQPWMREALLRRFERTLGEQMMARVWFLPALSEADFLGVIQIADVVLEPPGAGELLTSYDVFACAVPIITWPGVSLQTRMTHALYQKMEIQDCSVDSVETYVSTAVQLATDADLREQLCARIQERSVCLFEDTLAVTELQNFLTQVPLP
jgi:predicted O-linked N-acetylglucosamine transferase (SPINDLY family)